MDTAWAAELVARLAAAAHVADDAASDASAGNRLGGPSPDLARRCQDLATHLRTIGAAVEHRRLVLLGAIGLGTLVEAAGHREALVSALAALDVDGTLAALDRRTADHGATLAQAMAAAVGGHGSPALQAIGRLAALVRAAAGLPAVEVQTRFLQVEADVGGAFAALQGSRAYRLRVFSDGRRELDELARGEVGVGVYAGRMVVIGNRRSGAEAEAAAFVGLDASATYLLDPDDDPWTTAALLAATAAGTGVDRGPALLGVRVADLVRFLPGSPLPMVAAVQAAGRRSIPQRVASGIGVTRSTNVGTRAGAISAVGIDPFAALLSSTEMDSDFGLGTRAGVSVHDLGDRIEVVARLSGSVVADPGDASPITSAVIDAMFAGAPLHGRPLDVEIRWSPGEGRAVVVLERWDGDRLVRSTVEGDAARFGLQFEADADGRPDPQAVTLGLLGLVLTGAEHGTIEEFVVADERDVELAATAAVVGGGLRVSSMKLVPAPPRTGSARRSRDRAG